MADRPELLDWFSKREATPDDLIDKSYKILAEFENRGMVWRMETWCGRLRLLVMDGSLAENGLGPTYEFGPKWKLVWSE